jgi:hypothetical protein
MFFEQNEETVHKAINFKEKLPNINGPSPCTIGNN